MGFLKHFALLSLTLYRKHDNNLGVSSFGAQINTTSCLRAPCPAAPRGTAAGALALRSSLGAAQAGSLRTNITSFKIFCLLMTGISFP